jgi:hypothetical protein
VGQPMCDSGCDRGSSIYTETEATPAASKNIGRRDGMVSTHLEVDGARATRWMCRKREESVQLKRQSMDAKLTWYICVTWLL